MAGLNVPVLVQATPDTPGKMTIQDRRDSFCGKMSACNNLAQYGIRYSLTSRHTVSPDSADFRKDLAWFAATCRVVRGLRGLRIGAIGARPAAFNTVRYSEKLLEANGISVETIDLSEILGRIQRMPDNEEAAQGEARADPQVRFHRRRSGRSVDENGQARGGDRWVDAPDRLHHQRHPMLDLARRILRRCSLHRDEHDERELDVERLRSGYRRAWLACTRCNWHRKLPARCSIGITITATIRIKPSASTAAISPSISFKSVKMDFQQIIAGTVGRENTYGTCVGLVKAGPMSFARFSTNDREGKIWGYVGEGEFTDDPLNTFGGAGVVRISNLQRLLRYICENGFEHHVAANLAQVSGAVEEATSRYLGWSVHHHA